VTAARELLDRMQPDLRAWLDGAELDLAARHGDAIRAVGAADVVAEAFLADRSVPSVVAALAFAWRDLSFAAWRDVLACVSSDAPATYHFVRFAGDYLGVDVAPLLDDPRVAAVGRDFARAHASGRADPDAAWIRDQLAELGVDVAALRARLAAEGAPMLSGAPRTR
jgi:hypothetical protein